MIMSEKGHTILKGAPWDLQADLAIISYRMCGKIPINEVLEAVNRGIEQYKSEVVEKK